MRALLHIRAFRATFHVGTKRSTINVSMWKELLLDCPLWGLTAFNSSVGSLCQRDHQQRYVAITFPSSLLSFLSSVKAIHSSFTTQSSRFRKSDSPWTAVRTCHNRLLSCDSSSCSPFMKLKCRQRPSVNLYAGSSDLD